MLNKHLAEVQVSESQENLLLPSSISLGFDKLVLPHERRDVTNLAISVEPLDLKIGFREIDNFKKIGETFQNISDKIAQVEDLEAEQEIDYHTYESKRNEQREELKRMKENQEKPPRRSMEDIKTKEFIIQNVYVYLDSFNVSLMNDTDVLEYPLINICLNHIIAEYATGKSGT